MTTTGPNCAECSGPVRALDRFCTRCGAPVVVLEPAPRPPAGPPPARSTPPRAPAPRNPAPRSPTSRPAMTGPGSPWVSPARPIGKPPGTRTSSRRPLAVLALLLAAVTVTGLVLDDRDDEPAAARNATGPGGDLTASASAAASATAADGVDGAGNPTNYAAANVLDGDPTTAWRMDGDGTGAVLDFSFPQPVQLSAVGLVNGFAKVDPGDGTDRYPQGRRITHVTWTIGDLSVPQDLADGVRDLQTIPIERRNATEVTLRIDAVTAPGDPGYDRTVISDVRLAAG